MKGEDGGGVRRMCYIVCREISTFGRCFNRTGFRGSKVYSFTQSLQSVTFRRSFLLARFLVNVKID